MGRRGSGVAGVADEAERVARLYGLALADGLAIEVRVVERVAVLVAKPDDFPSEIGGLDAPNHPVCARERWRSARGEDVDPVMIATPAIARRAEPALDVPLAAVLNRKSKNGIDRESRGESPAPEELGLDPHDQLAIAPG